MVFEHYVMEQLPYGANIKIKSLTSNLSSKVPVGGIDFVTSKTASNTMTFQYEEINGTLVSISTSLSCTLDKVNKKITLSDSKIFGTATKPYIELHCNNVKVPISFVTVGNLTNKWYDQTISNDGITLKSYIKDKYAKFAKEFTISWSKDESNQQIFKGKDTSGLEGTEFYGCYATYMYKNGSTINKDVNQQVFIGDGQAPASGYVTIPRLDGTESSIRNGNTIKATKKFYKYFMLGLLVRITGTGQEVYKHETTYYVGSNSTDKNKAYNNTDFTENLVGQKYLQSSGGIPLLIADSSNVTKLDYKWHSNFFYITNEGKYISPSSSEIKHDWNFYGCQCDCNCQCDCQCQCQCHCQCDCQCECQCHCDFCNIGGERCDCECDLCDCQCNCNCDNCNCQCNVDEGCVCQCQSGICEGCELPGGGEGNCQCQSGGGGGGNGETRIKVTGNGVRGQFWVTWQGKSYLCNCSVSKTTYAGYPLSGGGALIYGTFVGSTGNEAVDAAHGPFNSSECSITWGYEVITT